MVGISLDARIRKKESIQALKRAAGEPLPAFLGSGETSHLPEAPNVPPDTNQLQKFRDQLLDIDRKKRQHLEIPPAKGSGFLKFSTILIVLLFALSAGLFFAGGYLYSYSNPPQGSAISAAGFTVDQNKPDWRLGTVIEGSESVQEGSVPSSYLARRTYLERNEVLADRIYSDGKYQSTLNTSTRNEAKRIASRTTSQIRSAVRRIFGETVSRIFNPLATTVVSGTVGSAIDKTLPDSSKKGSTTQETGAKSGGSDSLGTLNSGFGRSSTGSSSNDSSANSSGGSTSNAASPGSAKASSTSITTDTPDAHDGLSAPTEEMGALFALELQTFFDSTNAFAFMRQLREKGYTASYIIRSRVGQNMVYKVRVGNFATYSDAGEARKLIAHPSRVVLALQNDEHLKY
ncbi:MAG: SPOR domain-containing protein [Alphaproteobacteria bacterium]|nr:SPOR domain-containing protein [Alphaproteobacteria bacterium]NCQ67597.1 SPOR domain-containing protein [Alphaproteobacteria bacterium]NCT08369.1 SPOR domain-containing protein [Alphaproteobacteria bacterium]